MFIPVLLTGQKVEIVNQKEACFTVGFWSIEIAKKVFVTFDNVFHVYLMRGFQKYARN